MPQVHVVLALGRSGGRHFRPKNQVRIFLLPNFPHHLIQSGSVPGSLFHHATRLCDRGVTKFKVGFWKRMFHKKVRYFRPDDLFPHRWPATLSNSGSYQVAPVADTSSHLVAPPSPPAATVNRRKTAPATEVIQPKIFTSTKETYCRWS